MHDLSDRSLVKTPSAAVSESTALARELTAWDGFSVVAGSVIGSGIFLVPGAIALHLTSVRSVLLIWLVGGALSIFGALSLAEMASMFPAAGGLYTYLREAYGKVVAFLYGWGLLTMIQSGSIATLATGFGLYLSQLIPLTLGQQKLVSVASVVILTAANLMSMRHAKHIQNIGMGAKFLGLIGLAGLLFTHGHAATLRLGWNTPMHTGWMAYGIALIAVLWAYEGWHVVSFTAAEFRNPQRDLPRSLIGGTLFVAAIYLLLNVGYYMVLQPDQIAGVGSAAATAAQAAYGAGATRLISVLIVTSILVAINGMTVTGPRVYYAMARDRVFFQSLGTTNSHSKVPTRALLIQGIWASVLTLAGSFQQLFTSVVFTAWIFYGLAVAAVIVLRIKHPDRVRTFRTPGYPVLPILFVIAATVVVLSTIVSAPARAMTGFALIFLGLPLYFLFRWYEAKNALIPSTLEISNE
jgi:APA family basic amino acid/polyamine antiporter